MKTKTENIYVQWRNNKEKERVAEIKSRANEDTDGSYTRI